MVSFLLCDGDIIRTDVRAHRQQLKRRGENVPELSAGAIKHGLIVLLGPIMDLGRQFLPFGSWRTSSKRRVSLQGTTTRRALYQTDIGSMRGRPKMLTYDGSESEPATGAAAAGQL